MYQSLTGRAPFRSTNYNALMVDIMTRKHRPILELIPTLDAELARIVEECLVKERDRRLPSAAQLAERLSNVARRLATDPAELGNTPRRRATDLLVPPLKKTEGMAETGVPLGVRVFAALGLSSPSRFGIGLVTAALGVAAGFAAGRNMQTPQQVIIQAAPVAEVGAPKTAEPAAPQLAVRTVSPDVPLVVQSELSQAVSNGLRSEPEKR
jgi:hypothetical protein